MTWMAVGTMAVGAVSGMASAGKNKQGTFTQVDTRTQEQKAMDSYSVKDMNFRDKQRSLWQSGGGDPNSLAYYRNQQNYMNKDLANTYYGMPGDRSQSVYGQAMGAGALGGLGPRQMMAQMGKANWNYANQRNANANYIAGLQNQERMGAINQQVTGGINMNGGMGSYFKQDKPNYGMAALGGAAGGLGSYAMGGGFKGGGGGAATSPGAMSNGQIQSMQETPMYSGGGFGVLR